MIFVSLHVPENNPEFVPRISFFFLRILDFFLMENPEVIVFKEARGNYLLVGFFLEFPKDFLVSSHLAEIVKSLWEYILSISF